MTLDPTAALLEALTSHGLAARLEDGWIAVADSKALLRGRAHVYSTQPQGTVLRLDIQVGLPDGRLLVESNGSPGPDFDSALKASLEKLVHGSLHPLLAGFFGHREHQTADRVTLGGVEFDVFLGPILMQMPQGVVPDQPLVLALANSLRAVVLARSAERRAHWARVFYAQLDKKPEAFEALWDGEPWPEMEAALRAFAWPQQQGYLSAREFLVLVPVGDVATPGPHYRDLEKAVSLLVDVCASDKALNDDTVFERLVAGGVQAELAERVLTFGPLGFSAVLLRGCKLTEHYEVMGPRNDVTKKRFADEPVYIAAREVAASLTGRAEDKPRFFAVASRCSRYAVANQALARGTKLEEIVFEPPVVFSDDKPRQVPGAAKESGERAAPAAAKPWWKIW